MELVILLAILIMLSLIFNECRKANKYSREALDFNREHHKNTHPPEKRHFK